MRSSVPCLVSTLVILALTFACGPESLSAPRPAVTRSPLTATATYLDATATISVPDQAEPDTQFPITLSGILANGTSWTVSAWYLWENAAWSYDNNHMVQVSSGTLIAGTGFNWGNLVNRTILLTRPTGTYTYTFVLGSRVTHHAWYDVAVDTTLDVAPQQVVCDAVFSLPGQRFRAGRVVPVKFTAFECATGQFLHDEGIAVGVYDPGGALVASWSYTGNPHTGVAIDDLNAQYQVNWQTSRDQVGLFTVVVTFSAGDQLTGTVLLE